MADQQYKPTGKGLTPINIDVKLTFIQSTAVSNRTAPPTSVSAPASLPRARSTPMRLESRVVPLLAPHLPLTAHPAETLAALPRVVSSIGLYLHDTVNNDTEFAHGKVDPVEAGRKGGNTS
jgi:hypothetical protein